MDFECPWPVPMTNGEGSRLAGWVLLEEIKVAEYVASLYSPQEPVRKVP